MIHATFRTDPEDKGPDVMDLEPCDLAAFVGITREGKEDGYAYDTCVFIEKELCFRTLKWNNMKGIYHNDGFGCWRKWKRQIFLCGESDCFACTGKCEGNH